MTRALAVLFGGAGVAHFAAPTVLATVVPPWLAAGARPLVAVTGVAELAVGAAMLHPATRRAGASGAAGLIAVFLVAHVDAAARTGRDRPRWIDRPAGVVVRLVSNAGLLAWTLAEARRDASAPASPALRHLTDQRTVLLETFRRDGTPVATPVSIAVDGPRAVVRTFARAGKTTRLRRNPEVRVAPCTVRGTPTGPALAARARALEGDEARIAARLLRRKHPLLHGVLVPLAHRVGRRRTGRTVHYEIVIGTDPT